MTDESHQGDLATVAHKHELPPPSPNEPPEVTNARDMLRQVEADQDHLLLVIRRVLEAAEHADAETAEQLLRLAASAGSAFPGVANAVANRVAELRARKAHQAAKQEVHAEPARDHAAATAGATTTTTTKPTTAPSRGELIKAFSYAVHQRDWLDVAKRLNGFSDDDIAMLVKTKLTDGERAHVREAAEVQMHDWSQRVIAAIDHADPGAAHVAAAYVAFDTALATARTRGNYTDVANHLNGMGDWDLFDRVKKLEAHDLEGIRAAAPTDRVRVAIDAAAGVPAAVDAVNRSSSALLPAGLDWTSLLAHDRTGTHADAIPPAMRQQLAAIAVSRPARLAAIRPRAGSPMGRGDWVPYLGGYGWQRAGKQVTFDATGNKILDACQSELFMSSTSQEAAPSGIVTYDGTLSIGSGWANGEAADYVGRWLDKDHAARAALLAAGFTITADRQFAVIDDTGTILVGEPARAFLRRDNAGILEYLSNIMEMPGHTEHAKAAQTDHLQVQWIDPMSDALKADMQHWTKPQIGAAVHLGMWDPAGGPQHHSDAYLWSHGDPMKMLHVFAVKMASWTRQANGAFVLGTTGETQSPYVGHLDRFGERLFAGVLGAAPSHKMSFASAKTDPRWAGHVLVLMDGVGPNAAGEHRFADLGPRLI